MPEGRVQYGRSVAVAANKQAPLVLREVARGVLPTRPRRSAHRWTAVEGVQAVNQKTG